MYRYFLPASLLPGLSCFEQRTGIFGGCSSQIRRQIVVGLRDSLPTVERGQWLVVDNRMDKLTGHRHHHGLIRHFDSVFQLALLLRIICLRTAGSISSLTGRYESKGSPSPSPSPSTVTTGPPIREDTCYLSIPPTRTPTPTHTHRTYTPRNHPLGLKYMKIGARKGKKNFVGTLPEP